MKLKQESNNTHRSIQKLSSEINVQHLPHRTKGRQKNLAFVSYAELMHSEWLKIAMWLVTTKWECFISSWLTYTTPTFVYDIGSRWLCCVNFQFNFFKISRSVLQPQINVGNIFGGEKKVFEKFVVANFLTKKEGEWVSQPASLTTAIIRHTQCDQIWRFVGLWATF